MMMIMMMILMTIAMMLSVAIDHHNILVIITADGKVVCLLHAITLTEIGLIIYTGVRANGFNQNIYFSI